MKNVNTGIETQWIPCWQLCNTDELTGLEAPRSLFVFRKESENMHMVFMGIWIELWDKHKGEKCHSFLPAVSIIIMSCLIKFICPSNIRSVMSCLTLGSGVNWCFRNWIWKGSCISFLWHYPAGFICRCAQRCSSVELMKNQISKAVAEISSLLVFITWRNEPFKCMESCNTQTA